MRKRAEISKTKEKKSKRKQNIWTSPHNWIEPATYITLTVIKKYSLTATAPTATSLTIYARKRIFLFPSSSMAHSVEPSPTETHTRSATSTHEKRKCSNDTIYLSPKNATFQIGELLWASAPKHMHKSFTGAPY